LDAKTLSFRIPFHKKEKKMSKLMASVSGVRGIFGESLTPPIVQKYVSSFGLMQLRAHGNGRIIIG
jgi:phosphomannomutase